MRLTDHLACMPGQVEKGDLMGREREEKGDDRKRKAGQWSKIRFEEI